MSLISPEEIEYIISGVQQNVRNDGRGREDVRAIHLELGIITQASGSARCKLGETDVIVGVKVKRANSTTALCHCACSTLSSQPHTLQTRNTG
jgi:exosome complex component RRP42